MQSVESNLHTLRQGDQAVQTISWMRCLTTAGVVAAAALAAAAIAVAAVAAVAAMNQPIQGVPWGDLDLDQQPGRHVD